MLLLDEKKVTNEIMLREDLVGIVRGTSIEVIKNTMTNEIGLMPFAKYIVIANSKGPIPYEELFEAKSESSDSSKSTTKEASEEEQVKEALENFIVGFGNIFKEVAKEVEVEVKNMHKDVAADVEKFKEHIKPDIEKAVKGLHRLLKKADVEADILRLQSVKKYAYDEGIDTKGFIKKVDAKIAVLKAMV